MTTSTANLVCDNSSLANFKSWAQFVSNAFSAFGWVQTADTGQVNWGSIASVPASTWVYEVWKANDASAATMPIFVKVEYGFSATAPSLRFTAGTGSNGSGTITGQVVTSAPWEIIRPANQGAGTIPCYASGDAGNFRVCMWNNSGTPQITALWFVERARDGTGASTNTYVTTGYVNDVSSIAGSNSKQQSFSASTVFASHGGLYGAYPSLATGFDQTTTEAYPYFPTLGKVGNPFLGLMGAFAADAALNSTVTVQSMYGATHTYVAVGPNGNGWSGLVGGRSGGGAGITLMLFE